jgi:hypothetical protein
MVIVNRSSYEPTDIFAIQLECNTCHTTISFKPEEWKARSLNCPNCGIPLFAKAASGAQPADYLGIDSLIEALKTFRQSHSFKFTVRLEFDQV